jgi:hypothetical protein
VPRSIKRDEYSGGHCRNKQKDHAQRSPQELTQVAEEVDFTEKKRGTRVVVRLRKHSATVARRAAVKNAESNGLSQTDGSVTICMGKIVLPFATGGPQVVDGRFG